METLRKFSLSRSCWIVSAIRQLSFRGHTCQRTAIAEASQALAEPSQSHRASFGEAAGKFPASASCVSAWCAPSQVWRLRLLDRRLPNRLLQVRAESEFARTP